jgi:hypothetical protein
MYYSEKFFVVIVFCFGFFFFFQRQALYSYHIFQIFLLFDIDGGEKIQMCLGGKKSKKYVILFLRKKTKFFYVMIKLEEKEAPGYLVFFIKSNKIVIL